MIQAYQRIIIENVLFYVILFYLFFLYIVTSDLWIFSTVLRDDPVVDDMWFGLRLFDNINNPTNPSVFK